MGVLKLGVMLFEMFIFIYLIFVDFDFLLLMVIIEGLLFVIYVFLDWLDGKYR